MRQYLRHSILVYLTLVAYLVTGLVSLNEVVLCFGQDGHVALERTSANGNCEMPVVLRVLVSTWAAADTVQSCHCGPCFDVNLTVGDATSTRPLLAQDLIPLPNLLLLALPAPACLIARGPLLASQMLPSLPNAMAIATAPRSAILLI